MSLRLTYDELLFLMKTSNRKELSRIFSQAFELRKRLTGNKVYLRGLIELTNMCHKNCLYCGIRCANKEIDRFSLDDDTVVDAAKRAHDLGFGSIVIQSGEITGEGFTKKVSGLLRKIHAATSHELGITLSLGEQSLETYKEWHDQGAHRYLLRIETSSEELYYKLHPKDGLHDYSKRLKAIESLKKAGFQTGSGVMIGLPFQTEKDLVKDLLFMNELDLDMIGMGPFIPHHQTPLWKARHHIPTPEKRVDLSLRMIALLRLMMGDVNIASTTALETLDPEGRMKGILSGANVFMPNMTPVTFAKNYALYDNKPVTEDFIGRIKLLEAKLAAFGLEIGRRQRGDSRHYFERVSKTMEIK